MRKIEVPVFVVGTGPTGLAATCLLATQGIRTLAITRYPGTANSPRAHIINQRTMEVMRDLGIEERVLKQATPWHLMRNNVWATTFAGTEIARLYAWGNPPERKADYERASPSGMCNLPQHLMEPILADVARERGAQLMFNTELVSITQDADAVHSICRDRVSGEQFEVVSAYAIGADGDNGPVAKQIDFQLEGRMALSSAVNVWLEADLTKYTAHRPGVLYWMGRPGLIGGLGSATYVCVRPWNEWVMLFGYDPAKGEPDLSEGGLIERARTTIGDPEVAIRIKAVSKWTVNQMVATTYNKGRVLIAGNAAHRHPPANGLGANTCVHDAFNLCWKLALVLRGQAGAGLLDTYTQERQPTGHQVVERAIKSVQAKLPLTQALGFTPDQDEAAGQANLDEMFSDTPVGRERRQALSEAIALQNYQFNCHGVELGQIYASDAVVPDGTPLPQPARDPQLYYHATTHPGASLPHAWLTRNREQVSTLDLVGHGRFTLLTGLGGAAWRPAARRVAEALGVGIDVVSIGSPACDAQDVYGTWQAVAQISDAGALLVRPDRHVAWRHAAAPGDAAAQLRDVMRRVLALPA